MTRTVLRSVVAASVALLLGHPASAQTLTGLERSVACAIPPTSAAPPADAPHILGSQDPTGRPVYSIGDMLIIDRGRDGGLQLNQRYFVRRPLDFGALMGHPAVTALKTAGWITIVAVDQHTAVARIDQACDFIAVGDSLEPFTAPNVPDTVLAADTTGQPNFGDAAHVLFGEEERATAGTGEFMLIDRGAQAGVSVGSRFALYRDKGVADVPLAWVGEAAVVATGPSLSLVRISEARDAILGGDLAVPRGR